MLWPVLLNADPLDASWSLGERVSTRLRWLDHPDLPADLALRQVGVRASMLTGADGQPWAQLIEAGGLRAVRDGPHGAGHLTVDGCPGYDDFLRLIGELPVTVGIVRRVRVLHALHDRGTDGWIPRPGTLRFTDVPDASPERLRDDPDLDEPQAPQCEHEPGSMVWLSADEYYRLAYHQLPAEQWQGQGFLVDLDVADSAAPPPCSTAPGGSFPHNERRRIRHHPDHWPITTTIDLAGLPHEVEAANT